MRFLIHQNSRQGGRHDNQDRVGYVHSRQSLLMIVCDGMGGHAHGEVAAQYVMEYLAGAFRVEALPKLKDPAGFLQSTFLKAHDALIGHASARGLNEVPKTTCVACVVQEGCATWAHAGDSRIYHFRDGQLRTRSEDHSFVQSMIDDGAITVEQAKTHPDRHKVYSCIGNVVPPQVAVSIGASLRPGDRILLATDGIWGALAEETLLSAMNATSVVAALDVAMDIAEMQGGGFADNLSGILFEWIGESGLFDTAGSQEVQGAQVVKDADIDLALHAMSLAAQVWSSKAGR